MYSTTANNFSKLLNVVKERAFKFGASLPSSGAWATSSGLYDLCTVAQPSKGSTIRWIIEQSQGAAVREPRLCVSLSCLPQSLSAPDQGYGSEYHRATSHAASSVPQGCPLLRRQRQRRKRAPTESG